MQFLADWFRKPTTWVPVVIAAFVILTSVATHYGTRPAGILNRRQERAQAIASDKALAAARADSAKAAGLARTAQLLRATARRYEDSATYYSTHAPFHTPSAADSSYLARFWADLFR